MNSSIETTEAEALPADPKVLQWIQGVRARTFVERFAEMRNVLRLVLAYLNDEDASTEDLQLVVDELRRCIEMQNPDMSADSILQLLIEQGLEINDQQVVEEISFRQVQAARREHARMN